ncbi:hypothetical protein [Burkholderia mayonis]|uniref:Uncharacterized protein n=1 Tax=Burkholderia mayonis TaxID=1385591 RepID=A0A1B4G2A1_9BURK|nr:hypothetical protein [Burkholderia mayonis]AOJ10059.1 hypothetical protein WS71_22700 [Burkholderia mayonis]KVE49014.1 hypothetical protein WS71_17150 [Burkholderia mayonis]
MQFVDICIEFPSGILIADCGTYDAELSMVYVSSRVRALLAAMQESESPPEITASWDGYEAELIHSAGDRFAVVSVVPPDSSLQSRLGARLVRASWSRDQRQQFGRYLHTLSAAALAGAVGLWHSTSSWELAEVFNVAILVLFSMVSFLAGMDSMNGD